MTADDLLYELTLGPVTTESMVQRLEARGVSAEGAVRHLNGLVISGRVRCSKALGKVWYALKNEPVWEPPGTQPLPTGVLAKHPEKKLDWRAACRAVEDHAAGRIGEHLAHEALERAFPGFEVVGFKPASDFTLNPFGERKAKPAFDLETEILFVLENTDLLAPTAVTIMHRITAMKGLRPFELNYRDVLDALKRLRDAKKVGTLAPDETQGTGWFKMRRK